MHQCLSILWHLTLFKCPFLFQILTTKTRTQVIQTQKNKSAICQHTISTKILEYNGLYSNLHNKGEKEQASTTKTFYQWPTIYFTKSETKRFTIFRWFCSLIHTHQPQQYILHSSAHSFSPKYTCTIYHLHRIQKQESYMAPLLLSAVTMQTHLYTDIYSLNNNVTFSNQTTTGSTIVLS